MNCWMEKCRKTKENAVTRTALDATGVLLVPERGTEPAIRPPSSLAKHPAKGHGFDDLALFGW